MKKLLATLIAMMLCLSLCVPAMAEETYNVGICQLVQHSALDAATLMTTGDSASLEIRIAGALNQIMALYNVPAETRKTKIERVLRMDYRSLANRILQEFLDYIDQADEQLLEELLDA